MKHSLAWFVAGALLCSTVSLSAEIRFQEVSDQAGINGKGTTFGASWGDFNADGHPDLWVSNHNARPSLYINQRDGSFAEQASEVWAADPEADTHGAAWADVDRDGDLDLVEVVDVVVAENMCFGCGRNHFFENREGRLEEKSALYGLDRPLGQARTPLWLDANVDGQLDLIVINKADKGSPPVVLYLRKGTRFEVANSEYGLGRIGPKRKLPRFLDNWVYEEPLPESRLMLNGNIGFAQLTDWNDDERIELTAFGSPTRVFDMSSAPYQDLTDDLGLPDVANVSDVAVADFDGDGRSDLFVLSGPLPYNGSQMAMVGDNVLAGSLRGHQASIDNELSNGIQFKSRNTLIFEIEPEWFSSRNVAVGRDGWMPLSRRFELSSDDPAVAGMPDKGGRGEGTLRIGFDPDMGLWRVQNATAWSLVDFKISSDQPLTEFEPLNWQGFKATGRAQMFRGSRSGFVPGESLPEEAVGISCHSVVAEDFDNDRDMDLYIVCAGPARNLPNQLYENDGSGRFRLVEGAGGAAGSKFGRGDVVASADYDGDGDIDLFVTNGFDPTSPFVADGPHQLFANQSSTNRWLEVDLAGTRSNPDGIGAIVYVESSGVRQKRVQSGGMHLHAQNHARLHFGLGDHNTVDKVVVHWPSGQIQQLDGIPSNQILRVVEP